MSAQRYTALQICIICFLAFLLGGTAILRHPEWFDDEKWNDELHDVSDQGHISATSARPFITLGSATSTEDFRLLRLCSSDLSSGNRRGCSR